MQTRVATLALLLIASSLAGCTTSNDAQTVDHDSRIAELEASQQELTIALAEQEQTNSDLLASISQIESANMQAIQTLDADYQESLIAYQESIDELESSYIAALEAAAIANSQSLDEINATNAASFDNLLASLNTLQNNLQTSQDSINQISLIVDDLENENTTDVDYSSQIASLQQSLQSLQSNLQASILDLENRLDVTRAINDFSYLDFRGAQLFNFNNGLGVQMDPPIFDFAMMDNASLTYSNFSDASFVNAQLVGADGIFSTFHRTDFSGAQMYQGIWRQSDFSDALFVGSQLAYTEFRYSDLSGANLSGAVMYGGSDWLMVNLSGADLTNAWMYDVDLRYADLTGADLTGARLAYLNPSYGPADITGVTWTNAICPDGTHASTVGNTCANNL
ncbi:MAG: pentapeptide repeat-containing protein [Candidatus Thalassarchaeaceae archaeon]